MIQVIHSPNPVEVLLQQMTCVILLHLIVLEQKGRHTHTHTHSPRAESNYSFVVQKMYKLH